MSVVQRSARQMKEVLSKEVNGIAKAGAVGIWFLTIVVMEEPNHAHARLKKPKSEPDPGGGGKRINERYGGAKLIHDVVSKPGQAGHATPAAPLDTLLSGEKEDHEKAAGYGFGSVLLDKCGLSDCCVRCEGVCLAETCATPTPLSQGESTSESTNRFKNRDGPEGGELCKRTDVILGNLKKKA